MLVVLATRKPMTKPEMVRAGPECHRSIFRAMGRCLKAENSTYISTSLVGLLVTPKVGRVNRHSSGPWEWDRAKRLKFGMPL